MSIWVSMELRDPVVGIPNDTDEANYNGKGDATVVVDVATTWHDHARLAMDAEEVLLSPDQCRRLARLLCDAATICERNQVIVP